MVPLLGSVHYLYADRAQGRFIDPLGNIFRNRLPAFAAGRSKLEMALTVIFRVTGKKMVRPLHLFANRLRRYRFSHFPMEDKMF
jgi:hypothetical protein